MTIVMKFGGTSVGDAEAIQRSAGIVHSVVEAGRLPFVVLSAMRGSTDELLALGRAALEEGATDIGALRDRHIETAAELDVEVPEWPPLFERLSDVLKGVALLGELTDRTLDHILSFGERLSVPLFAAVLRTLGIEAGAHSSWELGLVTDSGFGGARPLPRAAAAIRERTASPDQVWVVTGFIAQDETGRITTLGRGGSDYSAAIFGAAMDAEEIQIWTDVDGILTADPRIVSGARRLEELSFEEAAELAYYGARVLHPATLLPAIEADVPIRVKNSFRPDGPGTRIVAHRPEGEAGRVRAIASLGGITLVNMVTTRMLGQPGFIAAMGEIFRDEQIPIDMIATSEVSVSCTVQDPTNLDAAIARLEAIAEVSLDPGNAIICAVGEGLRDAVGVAGRIFETLGRAGVPIKMISQGATRINVGFVVAEEQKEAAVRALHDEFFSDDTVE